jgi:hypothetical protein
MGCYLRLIKTLTTLFAELRFSAIDFSAVGTGDLDWRSAPITEGCSGRNFGVAPRAKHSDFPLQSGHYLTALWQANWARDSTVKGSADI